MMVDFSGRAPLDGFFAPQRFEADVADCQVLGQIPADLDGAFVRIGSDWAYPPLHADDAPFNEDGYVSRFRFRGGRCSYRGRWIKTRRYKNNHAAGRQLYGYYRNPWTDDPLVRDVERPALRSTANTAPMAHAGRLFALKEDGLPHEIDPVTLDTLEVCDFHGGYKSQTFTAHPKTDPVTGEMFAYGYEATGPASNDLWFTVLDKTGKVTRELRLKTPYVSMVHDIALTRTHIVIPVFPYVTSLEWLKAGRIHWAWDHGAPLYYGVLPRDGEAKDLRWFKGPPRAVVHTLNARSEGEKVILEAPIFDGNPFPFFPALDGTPWNPEKGRALIRRVTFDLASKDDGFHEEILFGGRAVSDLMRIDDRFVSLPYRYGYTAFQDPQKPFTADLPGPWRRRLVNSYGRFDLHSGETQSYFAGPCHSLQEVQFVPRKGSNREGDGYLLGVAGNFAESRSELVIVDAEHLAAGDLARVILPFRSTLQVHGKWFTAEELPALGAENP
jgi:carotenoid cleavage dioxygenase